MIDNSLQCATFPKWRNTKKVSLFSESCLSIDKSIFDECLNATFYALNVNAF